jgi:inorganic pyrophosphatase
MKTVNMSKLPAFDKHTGALNIVVEAPKGRRTKFKYDEKQGLFKFDKSLPDGFAFPFDFGFVPSTRGGDGDPLDVIVLTDEPTFVGCVVPGKLLGILEAEQTSDGKTERNDRLIAMPLNIKSGKPAAKITKLDERIISGLRNFFVSYNQAEGKKFKPIGQGGPERAMQAIKHSINGVKKSNKRRKAA